MALHGSANRPARQTAGLSHPPQESGHSEGPKARRINAPIPKLSHFLPYRAYHAFARGHPRSYACFRRLMSSFSICSTAFMTLFAFSASLSCNSFPKTVGTICHDRTYLSLSQPHLPPLPPCESFSHSSSTSCCVSLFTKKDMASENLKCGPPFSAMNSCPSSWNVTVITVPFALPETLAASSP